jgi:MFS transporter, MCT family, solute carrier family 16 (monocarboxylic acid transporters), member 10
MKPRTPPARDIPGFFDFRGITTSPAYVTYVFSNFIAYLGLFTRECIGSSTWLRNDIFESVREALTFITVEAEAIGTPSSLAFYMVAIANGATIFGRLLFGISAIKFGALNLTIISTMCVLVLTLAWAFVTWRPGYIIVSCIYGWAANTVTYIRILSTSWSELTSMSLAGSLLADS